MRTLTAFAALTATFTIPIAAVWFTPVARADSLSAKELNFIAQHGTSLVCASIANNPTIPGVVSVVEAIVSQGFSAKEAVDVTHASVAVYCPNWWKLLQQTGKAFQTAEGGQRV